MKLFGHIAKRRIGQLEFLTKCRAISLDTPKANQYNDRARAAYPAHLCPGSSGVEQWTENPRVGGSIPPPGTIVP